MKTILAAFLLFGLSIQLIAQNYSPFDESVSKRFFAAGDPNNNDFFFHIDGAIITGNSINFSQYHPIQYDGSAGNFPNDCIFWGGTTGDVLDTTWLGNQINWNTATQELILENEANEILNFNFGLAIGASAQFYSDGTTNYFIEHTSTVLETFLSVSDSVQIFTINAFDLGGTPVSSPLNNFEIKLSKNHGLISFIDCYNFPINQQGFEIQGQTNPLIGAYQLSYDDCFPWQINDVLQYSTFRSYGSNGPPTNNAFQTTTVVDRIETADSVKLFLFSTLQELNSGTPIPPYGSNGNSTIFFKKGTPISERPWNMTQSDLQTVKAVEGFADHCGQFERFKTQEEFTIYCDSCHCIGSFDGFGDVVEKKEFVKNYGIFSESYLGYGPFTEAGQGGSTLVYSNVNGVECGTLWNDLDELKIDISIAPNPSKDLVKINADQLIESMKIRDLSGRLMFEQTNLASKSTEISLASFQKGAYILEIQFENAIQTRTIIRE